MRTYVEGDFVSSVGGSSNPAQAGADGSAISAAGEIVRLRHAYGTLGPLLIGHTGTVWGGLIGAPEVLDDGGPLALGALRLPQIRLTLPIGGGWLLHVSAEEAGNIAGVGPRQLGVGCTVAGACAALSANAFLGVASGGIIAGPQRMPDFVAALQWNLPDGGLYLSGTVGQLSADNGASTVTSRHDDALKYGFSLGARYNFGRIEVGGQGYLGWGMGGKHLAPANGNLDALVISTLPHRLEVRPIFSYSGLGWVQFRLTDTIRSTFVYSYGLQDVLAELPGGRANKAALGPGGVSNVYWSVHTNLLWNPVPQVTLGVEYSYQFSSRYNSANVNLNRISFAGIYRF